MIACAGGEFVPGLTPVTSGAAAGEGGEGTYFTKSW